MNVDALTPASAASRLFRAVCHFAGAHPDVATESNSFDRGAIAWQAFSLALATTLALVAWAAFFATFLPVASAVGLALLVALFVFTLDRAMLSSDWTLSGILKQGRPAPEWWFKLLIRVGVAYVLAQATASGALLWVFSGAIEGRLQRDRTATNAPLVQEFEARKAAERHRVLEPVQSELAALQREREELMRMNRDVTRVRNESRAQARTAANEVGRELDGYGGRAAGAGPRWREAGRAEEAAAQVARQAEHEAAQNRARIEQLAPLIEARGRELRELSARQAARDEVLDAQMKADPRWVREQRDPLSAWIGLGKLREDPEYGPTASDFSLLMTTVLLVLELSVLATKTVFSPPSVYMVRLIERTKREAIEVLGEEAEAVRQSVHAHRPRGRLRVIDGDAPPPDQPENPQQGAQ